MFFSQFSMFFFSFLFFFEKIISDYDMIWNCLFEKVTPCPPGPARNSKNVQLLITMKNSSSLCSSKVSFTIFLYMILRESPLKIMINAFLYVKSSFHSLDIQIYIYLSFLTSFSVSHGWGR